MQLTGLLVVLRLGKQLAVAGFLHWTGALLV